MIKIIKPAEETTEYQQVENWNKNKYLLIASAAVLLLGTGAFFTSNLINSNSINSSQNTNIATLETISAKKDDVEFTYNQTSKVLKYKGTINLPNGCSSLGSGNLVLKGDTIHLSIGLNQREKTLGNVCTQQLVNVPISGESRMDLNQATKDNLANKIQIIKFTDSSIK